MKILLIFFSFHFLLSFFLFFNIYQKQTLNLEVWLEWITVCICNVANILGRVSLKKEHHFALVRNLKFGIKIIVPFWSSIHIALRLFLVLTNYKKEKYFAPKTRCKRVKIFAQFSKNSSLPLCTFVILDMSYNCKLSQYRIRFVLNWMVSSLAYTTATVCAKIR